MRISVSSFRPMQPGPFVHDLVLLLFPFPQVSEHLLHFLYGCLSDNSKTPRKQRTVKIALCCSYSSGFGFEILIGNYVFPTNLLTLNATGRFGLADLCWPFRYEPFRYEPFRAEPFWSGPFRSGRFSLGTFLSRHFCKLATDYISLYKWLCRQAKYHAIWCYANALIGSHDCD